WPTGCRGRARRRRRDGDRASPPRACRAGSGTSWAAAPRRQRRPSRQGRGRWRAGACRSSGPGGRRRRYYRTPGRPVRSFRAMTGTGAAARHPFLGIWLSPRETIRSLVAEDPTRGVLVMSWLGGLALFLDRMTARVEEKFPLAMAVV